MSRKRLKQAMEMLSESGRQIERMDAFVEAMRKLSSLENRELITGEISAKQLEKDIRAELAILEKEYGKDKPVRVSQKEDETIIRRHETEDRSCPGAFK